MSSDPERDAIETAYEAGRQAGADLGKSARDSPYMHDQLALRSEWLKGFGTGRSVTLGLLPGATGG